MQRTILGLLLIGTFWVIGCGAAPPAALPSPTITVLVTKAVPPPTDTRVVAVIQPTNTAAPVPTTAPTPSPIPSSTPVPLTVGNTNGDGIWLRATPLIGDKLKALPDGTQLVVVGPDQTVGGKVWKNVKDPGGTVGWVAGDFLLTADQLTSTPSPAKNTLTATPAS